ncbi:hypothetical protein VP01_2043g5 [Puccinia sorghi]|uniref:Developmental regulatory protein wetA n=1 Tax=Puccinia sorghi TaxID=27349 RepID=A0A0L6VBI0_9BASI|nr:hypothetical protein VP01_2043g5 [Puccinia sorghi]
MSFDPNTGLPWGTNPFKVTSQETYEPLLPPPQFNTSFSSSGMNPLMHHSGLESQLNLPFSNFSSHEQAYPPSFTSSIDPIALNPSPSTFSWPGPQQPFDFSLLDGAGHEEEHKANAAIATSLFPNLATPYDSLPMGEAFDNTPTMDFLSEEATLDPINFTTNDFDHLLASMNGVGMQPSMCVTPPPQAIKVPSTPKKTKASGGFSQAIRPPCVGSSFEPSPSPQRGSVYGFSSESPQISPKGSISNFPVDFSCDSSNGRRYNNPFLNTPPSTLAPSFSSPHVSPRTPQKSKSLTPQIGKNRRQMSVTTPSSDRKAKGKSPRNKSLQDSTPSKPSRTFSMNSASKPTLNSAIFVNFTARDSKKLLNGVAPSGSSKRKKTLDGDYPQQNNKSSLSSSDLGGDSIKKRRVLSNST